MGLTFMAMFEADAAASSASPSLGRMRRLSAIKACHYGPGCFDDFKFLFDPVACSLLCDEELAAYREKFQSIYRLTTDDWTFVRRHIGSSLRRRRDKRGRPPIPVDTQMAAALIYLAHGTTYATTSIMIRNGLSEASTLRCVRMFTKAVVTKLYPTLVAFPKSVAGLDKSARAFERRSGIPDIVGAIDGSHIRVAPPKCDQRSYYNRKHFYSVILSAVVDARGAFMACDVGYPGRMSDSKVLKYCKLYTHAVQWFGRFGYYIYGDAAYPLRTW